jgi:hypothetical protein
MSDPIHAEPQLPPRVARSEDELIRLARRIVAGGRGGPLPRGRASTPITAIGPTAMGLLKQTLARGVTAWLLRRGGWQTRRTLVDGHARRGRWWERHRELPTLHFGPASFELLVWLHNEDLARPARALERRPDTSLADDLLHYLALGLALEQLAHTGVCVQQAAFSSSPLCQLGHFDALARGGALPSVDFTALVEGPGAILIEALQPDLAARWVAVERRKGAIVLLDDMIQLGRAQTQVLDGWLAAVDRVEPRRRELAGFVAEAARELLARGPDRRCPDHRWWIRSLSLQAPLAARQAAFVAAAAFLRGVGRLGAWLDEAGVVAHFDDDYEAAQLWLSSWAFLRERPERSPIPSSILERAHALTQQLESLHSLGLAQPPEPP